MANRPSSGRGIRFRSLSSSSRHGNAYLVITPGATVLADCGVPLRRLEGFLRDSGVAPADIDAIFITHEHTDHCRALKIRHPFDLRHSIGRMFSTPRTWRALHMPTESPHHPLVPGTAVQVGDLQVVGLRNSHDAAQPISLKFTCADETLAVVTDLGTVDPGMVSALRGSTYLVVESNHDVQMEMESGRPASLIRRVLSDFGHLSNDQAGASLQLMVGTDTRAVLLAHLSTQCNTPELARNAVAAYLDGTSFTGDLLAAPPDRPGPWLGEAPRRADETDRGTPVDRPASS
ncbi:MAG: MBL fold metallo-hydrolase [Bacillota bacterium]